MKIGDNMRYIVKINELGKIINYLEQQLSIIDENITNLKSIKSSIIWQGRTSSLFLNKYDNYILELTIMTKNILALLDYLTKYYDKYGDRYMILHQKYAKYYNEVM